MATQDGLQTFVIPLTGGYRYCGSHPVGLSGYSDTPSLNYIQTVDGLKTRVPPYAAWLFETQELLLALSVQIDQWLATHLYSYEGVAYEAKDFLATGGVVSVSRHLENTTAYIVYAIKGFVKIGGLGDTPAIAFVRTKSSNLGGGAAVWEVLGVEIFAIMRKRQDPVGPLFFDAFMQNIATPSVVIAYYKNFYIITFPNFYGRKPRLIFNAAGTWDYTSFNNSALSASGMPTVCVVFNVAGSPAQHLVWGCALDGTLRVTLPLTEENVKDETWVKNLLCNDNNKNFVVPAYGGTGSLINRGLAEFNGVLIAFGLYNAIIISQLVAWNKDTSKPELAPMYQRAPFRGGCIGQEGLTLGWNELFIASVDGDIYSISRVIESGSYKTASVLKPSGLLTRDPSFTFKDSPWMDQYNSNNNTEPPLKYPGRSVQLVYDYLNDVVIANYSWWTPKQGDPAGLQKYALGNYVINNRVMGYNKNVPDSTGWSQLEAPGQQKFVLAGGMLNILPAASSANAKRLRVSTYLEDFVWANALPWKHVFSTPFMTAVSPNAKMLFRALHLEIDKLDGRPLVFKLQGITETDPAHVRQDYLVPAPFVFDNSLLDEGRFAIFASQNSFTLGMMGAFFQFTISSEATATPPGGHSQMMGAHVIAAMVLWAKQVGGNLYEDALSATR